MKNKLLFKIGDLVKMSNSNDAFIILATKEKSLTESYLLNSILKITDISEIATNNITVNFPYDYTVGKIKSFSEDVANLDSEFLFAHVYEDEIKR